MVAKEHNKILGILFLVYSVLQVVGLAVAIIVMIAMMGVAAAQTRGRDAIPAVVIFGMVIGILVIAGLFVLPIIIAGWKILKEKAGGRTWGIVAAILALLNFPLGTAVGIYGLWFLLGEEGKRFYLGGGNPNMMSSQQQQPPPQSWQ
ncbi:MAG TPA: hypothetical protein VGO50_15730 [Pyrinomonadaceae bacterium]|jgi:hypothetical protein|nr:hypothetical protein [Pyrinomonadaceae bacterium]